MSLATCRHLRRHRRGAAQATRRRGIRRVQAPPPRVLVSPQRPAPSPVRRRGRGGLGTAPGDRSRPGAKDLRGGAEGARMRTTRMGTWRMRTLRSRTAPTMRSRMHRTHLRRRARRARRLHHEQGPSVDPPPWHFLRVPRSAAPTCRRSTRRSPPRPPASSCPRTRRCSRRPSRRSSRRGSARGSPRLAVGGSRSPRRAARGWR